MSSSNVVRFPGSISGAMIPSVHCETSARQRQLIGAMTFEMTSAALLVAVATGALTSRISSRKTVPFDLMLRLLPPAPAVFPAARCMPREEVGGDLLDRCADYYDLLGAAKAKLMQLRQLHAEGHGLQFADKDELAELWQATCSAGVLALYEIDRQQSDAQPAGVCEQFNLICEALIAARDGKSPYLDQGIPVLPEWAERRHAKRFVVNATATLSSPGRRSTIMVTNVSRSGFGLDFVSGLVVGDFVSIEFFGRKFIATVTWNHGRRAGVALRKPLSALDPLLSS